VTHCWLTESRRRPTNPPCPREPTTSISASRPDENAARRPLGDDAVDADVARRADDFRDHGVERD